jgi:hypothetical protein
MPTITNKTQRPLSVPLPRGKILHLGPGKSGEIASHASEHPQLKKLVEAGEIEILADGPRSSGGMTGGKKGRTAMGYASGSGARRSGDR